MKRNNKVKNALDIIGKKTEIQYSPLIKKNRDKMVKADKLEVETEIGITPMAFEDGVSPAMRNKIMGKVKSNRDLIKKLRSLR